MNPYNVYITSAYAQKLEFQKALGESEGRREKKRKEEGGREGGQKRGKEGERERVVEG